MNEVKKSKIIFFEKLSFLIPIGPIFHKSWKFSKKVQVLHIPFERARFKTPRSTNKNIFRLMVFCGNQFFEIPMLQCVFQWLVIFGISFYAQN